MIKIGYFHFLIFLFIVETSFCQGTCSIGIKGGINSASLIGSSGFDESFSYKSGYHAGLFVSYRVGRVAVQPEFIFSQQGSSGAFNGQTLTTNYDFINVPVIFKYYFQNGFNLQFGSQIGVLKNAKEDIISNQSIVYNIDTKHLLNNADGSVVIGFGYDTPFAITFDARYILALTPIRDFDGNTRNQVFQFSLGIKIFKFGVPSN